MVRPCSGLPFLDGTPIRRRGVVPRYVEALGGELEILARFGDKTVKLHGV
jgi:hypothetical protein